MSKYDFARRLKRMVCEECEIIKAETKVAQKSANYYEQITSLKTILSKQDQEVSKHRKAVEELKRENDKKENCVKQLDDMLFNLEKIRKQMEVDYHQIQQKQVEQRRTALLQMDCIHSLKLATKTFFNLNALPQFAQGVIIKEKEWSSEWQPFRINLTQHTLKEVQDIIWNVSEVESVYKQTWETLILGDLLPDANKFTEMETENVSISVVK